MININEAYQFLNSQANKNFGGGFTIDRFNLNWKQACISFFWNCLGFDEQSKGNQYANNNFASATQVNTESLRPFYVQGYVININNGIGQLPSDYAYIDALLNEYMEGGVTKSREIVQIDSGTKGWILDSSLMFPTLEYPKFEFVNDTIKVYPNFNVAYLSYWKQPVTGEWKFTLVNNRPVYDPVTSVQCEFNSKDTYEIVARTARLLGINIKDADLIQFSNQNIAQGA